MQQKPKKSTAPKKPAKKQKKSVNPANSYKGLKDAWGNPVGGEGTTPPFTPAERKKMPKVGNMGSAKNGKAVNKKSFPDLNKDGKITKADILKGRGVIAKKGASVKKAKSGTSIKKCMQGCK